MTTVTKFCKVCLLEQPLINFYVSHKATPTRNQVLSTLCKECSNKKRIVNYNLTYEPKKTGFRKLDLTIRQEILTKLSNGVQLKVIAKDYDIKYQTLIAWKKNGKLI